VHTLIYARFSSDLQNDRSIDDQVADCRARCDREGWTVVDVFTDYAVSGGAGISEAQRPGMGALLERVKAGGVDQVLADTSSRIARDLGDFDRLRKLLAFHDARLFSLADGELDSFKGTVKALIDEQQRKDTAHNIRRGQRGRALAGMNPGGMAYGYRKVPRFDDKGEAILGLREIDADQAAIVVRIFEEFAGGKSVRKIIAGLNAERVPGPNGRPWRISTVHGHSERRNGILRNDLYRGRVVYNRTRKVEHPISRKKTIRLNPEDAWTIVEAPDLRIISDDLWERAQGQLRGFGGGLKAPRKRSRRLLSGKAYCSQCGATWRVVQKGRYGCAAHHDGRGCSNGRTITADSFEKRVIRGLSEQMLEPAYVEAWVEEYRAEWSIVARSKRKDHGRLERRLADAEARIVRYVAAIGDGRLDVDDVAGAIAEAKEEKARCQAELGEIAAAEKVIELHPRIAGDYRRRITNLLESLNKPDAEESREAFRALIDRIDVSPREETIGVSIEVTGLLQSIVALAGGELPRCTVPLVPLGGIQRNSTLLKIAV
jgi:site-specific DNA recombinase